MAVRTPTCACRIPQDTPFNESPNLEYPSENVDSTAVQWLLREVEGIRMDDCASTSRKRRWLQEVELFMNRHIAAPSGLPASKRSVTLVDLDTMNLLAEKIEAEEADASVSVTVPKTSQAVLTPMAGPAGLPQVSESAARDPPAAFEGNNSPSVSDDVIKRLANVVGATALSLADNPLYSSRNYSSSVIVSQSTSAGLFRTFGNHEWAKRARMKLEDFESNAWCILVLQCFTLLLSFFELSELCPDFGGTQNEICRAFNIIDLAGNVLFTLEVLLYITIFPWKYLCKSFHFWVDVVAVITYYILLTVPAGGKEVAAMELLAISIPCLRILKITRRSKAWPLLVMALKRSAEPIHVPALFLMLVISIGSCILYWLEKYASPLGANPAFESIRQAVWFSIVTVSTVGYGDVTPHTEIGKLVCIALIGLGVCCFAMPLAVVGETFCVVWEQRDVILLAEKLKYVFSMAGVTFGDLQHIFDLVDVDGSGDMDLDEFERLFHFLKLNVGRRELLKFFSLMDWSGRGKVSLEEFREHLAVCQALEVGPRPMRTRSADFHESRSVKVFGYHSSNRPRSSRRDSLRSGAPHSSRRDGIL